MHQLDGACLGPNGNGVCACTGALTVGWKGSACESIRCDGRRVGAWITSGRIQLHDSNRIQSVNPQSATEPGPNATMARSATADTICA